MAKKTTQDVSMGSQARVEIIKTPSNAAALKTVRRILAKDERIAANKRRAKESRAGSMRVKQRGGRPWEHRPKMKHAVDGVVGEAGTVKVTQDVLNDLKSVSRFVKVTAA